jgi:GTP-binding protein Era
MQQINFKSGYIGLIGRTNVGKSTLINRIIKSNTIITSDRAQTTRNRINCIYNTKNMQAIFVDSPGFFKPKDLLGKRLNSIIYGVINDVDIITVMVDIADGIGSGDHYVFEQVSGIMKPRILILNKIDLLGKDNGKFLKSEAKSIQNRFEFFDDIISISALKEKGIKKFMNSIIERLPEGPQYYPEDIITDLPLSKIIAEIIRAKLSDYLYEELPHSINVELTDKISTKTKNGEPLTTLNCLIYVEKKSQKGIVIGKSGKLLKKVGESARIELEKILGTKVYLNLWVKVLEHWTKSELYLNRLGY